MNKYKSAVRFRGLAVIIATMLTGAVVAEAPAARASHGTAEDIRDIRGPLPLPSSWWTTALLAVGVGGAGVGCAAWALHRRRKAPYLTPAELALARLEAARSLIGAGNSREYSITVSSITRQFIEDAFGVRATHLTTDEFLRHFANTPDSALGSSQVLLSEFLQGCDLAKFGGWHLSASGMIQMSESARQFILEPGSVRAASAPASSAKSNRSKETYVSLPST